MEILLTKIMPVINPSDSSKTRLSGGILYPAQLEWKTTIPLFLMV